MLIRFFSFFLLLSMLVPAGSLGSVLYQCRLDGQVRQACCCGNAGSQTTPAVFGGQEGCCDLKETKDQPASATHERILPSVDSPQVVDLPLAIAYSPLSELSFKAPAGGVLAHPPRGAPPVYLRTCSFLI